MSEAEKPGWATPSRDLLFEILRHTNKPEKIGSSEWARCARVCRHWMEMLCRPDTHRLDLKLMADTLVDSKSRTMSYLFYLAIQLEDRDVRQWVLKNPHFKPNKAISTPSPCPFGSKFTEGPVILWLIEKGDKEGLNKLLAHPGTDPNAGDDHGSALHHAIRLFRDELIPLLLGHRSIDCNTGWEGNGHGLTPLHEAVRKANNFAVSALLACPCIDPNIENDDFDTPLDMAIGQAGGSIESRRNLEALRQLLAHPKLKVDQKDPWGNTIFTCADDEDWPRLLAHPSISPYSLFYAIQYGNEEQVKRLLSDQDTNPNQKNPRGETPLNEAIRCQREAILELLLADPRTDPDLIDGKNLTPLDLAIKLGYHRAIERLLADPRTNPDKGGHPNHSPLHRAFYRALYHKEPKALSLLIGCPRVNPNVKGRKGRTLLHLIGEFGLDKFLEPLLAHPSLDPDVTDAKGRTPLLLALKQGYPNTPLLLRLLDHCDPHLPDKDGWFAWHYALLWEGHSGVLKRLLDDPRTVVGESPLLSKLMEDNPEGAELVRQRMERDRKASSSLQSMPSPPSGNPIPSFKQVAGVAALLFFGIYALYRVRHGPLFKRISILSNP